MLSALLPRSEARRAHPPLTPRNPVPEHPCPQPWGTPTPAPLVPLLQVGAGSASRQKVRRCRRKAPTSPRSSPEQQRGRSTVLEAHVDQR